MSRTPAIPDGIDCEVGCLYEALVCTAWAARRMDVKLGDTVWSTRSVAGNILLQEAIKSGASQVIAVDIVDKKLAIAEEMGANVTINASEEDSVERVDELTDDEGVDVAIEAVDGTGIDIKQALGMVAHNGVLALYGDNYEPIDEFCYHRFHADGLEVQNLNAMHYTELQAVKYAREAYRVVKRDVFDIQMILNNSAHYSLDELPQVFEQETDCPDAQKSLKTLIIP